MKKICIILAQLSLLWTSLGSAFAGAATPAEPVVRLTGEAVQGALIVGNLSGADADAQVFLDDRELKLSPAGDFVFGIGRDDRGSVTLTVKSAGQQQRRELTIGTREFDIQYIEGVEQKHVDPPADVLARIARENQEVARARTADSELQSFAGRFIWPLTGPITGVYGSQRFYNGSPRSPHYGIDIAAPTGTRVVAPADGVVTLAQGDLYFSGGTLILDHGHGVSSTFIHLHKLLVTFGEKVEQGQAVAEVGATGRATGPHLDWRMNWFGVRVDPQVLMAAQNNPMPSAAEE